MADLEKIIDLVYKLLTQSPYVTGFGMFASLAFAVACVWLRAYVKNQLIKESREKEQKQQIEEEAKLPGSAVETQKEAESGEQAARDRLRKKP